jgi:hypothetical protein
MINAGRRAMGGAAGGGVFGGGGAVALPTLNKKMGIFGPGMTVSDAQRFSKMPHPTIPGLNALGHPMPGIGGGGATAAVAVGKVGGSGTAASAAKGEIDSVSGAYKALMGLYAARVVGGVFVDAVKGGSDMIETLQKTRVVFGAATATVTNMADDMAKKYGSNKGVMLDTASQFGLIGQAAHMSEGKSAGMAVAMTRLAADASSFYNVPLDVALQKIQAGLVGQSRPLREFGVLLNIGTVNAKAAEMGFKALHGQFTEGEKVMARMQLITEGLAKATGDLGRTIDSPAHAYRRLSGEWENFKTAQGMPIAAGAAAMVAAGREEIGKVEFSTQNRKVPEQMWEKTANSFLGGLLGGIGEGLIPNHDKIANIMGAGSKELTSPIMKGPLTGMAKFLAEREAYDTAQVRRDFDKKQFGGGGFGAFGLMGNLGMMMANEAMGEHVTKKIDRAQQEQDRWGGGHVTDPLSFMRDAQEKILTPLDATAKEQLAELKAIREVLESKEGSEGGMILKGREN